jgi:hypothetical protein
MLPLLDDVKTEVAIAPLSFGEEGDAYAAARAYAIKKGVADPKSGEPIYERALALHIVEASVFDAEHVPDKRIKFFDSIQQIEEVLDHDRVAMLFQWQRAWQREISPSPKGFSPQEYLRMVVATAEADEKEEIPFDYLPPTAQRNLLRFTNVLCLSLLQLRSPSGSRLPEDAETLIGTLTLASIDRVKSMLQRSSVPSQATSVQQGQLAANEGSLVEQNVKSSS